MTGIAGDVTRLASAPPQYVQLDENQTRRMLEQNSLRVQAQFDEVNNALLAQVVTDAVIKQDATEDIIALTAGVPQSLDFFTSLSTIAFNRWSQPVDGTLRYTAQEFTRLGIGFFFFELSPASNNRTFVLDFMVNDVISRSMEFQTGTSGLFYPVSMSGSVDFPIGDTDMRLQITCTSDVTVTIKNFEVAALDLFSASSLQLDNLHLARDLPETSSVVAGSFIRFLGDHLATLLQSGLVANPNQNTRAFVGGLSLSELATGYAQQRGSGTIIIPAVNTWVPFSPPTTLNESSSSWTQPSDAALIIVNDTQRLGVMKIIMILDTAAANQNFEFRTLIDGVPVAGVPFGIILIGNSPQEQAFGFDLLVAIGESEISFEVRNITSAQDLDVLDYIMSASDTLAQG